MDQTKSQTKTEKPLRFAEFKQESVVFEARFADAYLLWDRAGTLWTEALAKWPGLKNIEGSPAKTSFSLDNKFLLTVELDKVSGAAFFPKASMRDFLDTVSPFLDIVKKELRIEEYSRLGCRQIFFQEYSNKSEASAALVNANLLHIPPSPQLGIEAKPLLPDYAVRWEGSSNGATIRIKAEERIIDFEPSLGLHELEEIHLKKYRVVLDIDYFTFGSVSIAQFRLEDWINQVAHTVRRDIDAFLGRG